MGQVLIFQLSFYFPDSLLNIPFNLLNLALDLFGFIARQFTNFFTNLSLDFFTLSFYFVNVHNHSIHIGINNTSCDYSPGEDQAVTSDRALGATSTHGNGAGGGRRRTHVTLTWA
jgi:hypothetical protein